MIDYGDSDPWAFAAAGDGASLDLIDPMGTTSDLWDKPYSWRASVQVDGTPGSASTPASGILINEILAHTDDPEFDSIEIFNPTDSDHQHRRMVPERFGPRATEVSDTRGNRSLQSGDYVDFERRGFQSCTSPSSHRNPVSPSMLPKGIEVFLTEVVGQPTAACCMIRSASELPSTASPWGEPPMDPEWCRWLKIA